VSGFSELHRQSCDRGRGGPGRTRERGERWMHVATLRRAPVCRTLDRDPPRRPKPPRAATYRATPLAGQCSPGERKRHIYVFRRRASLAGTPPSCACAPPPSGRSQRGATLPPRGVGFPANARPLLVGSGHRAAERWRARRSAAPRAHLWPLFVRGAAVAA
jgi:hypothetical protein